MRRAWIALWVAGGVSAQPATVPYQGYLADDAGAPVSGTVDLFFKLYATPAGGAATWEEDIGGVVVEDGLFSVELALSPGDLLQDDLWLGVAVDDEAMEMTPRQRVGAVPWAYVAGDARSVDGIPASQFQLRVAGSCAGGDAVRAVNADGTVVCEPDDLGTGGGVTSLDANLGLSSTGSTGNVTVDVDFGSGLTVVADALAVDFSGSGVEPTVARSDHGHGSIYVASGGFTGPCGPDFKVYQTDAGGNVFCDFDLRTNYGPGANLQMLPGNLLETQDSLSFTSIDAAAYRFAPARTGYYSVNPSDFHALDSGDPSYVAAPAGGGPTSGAGLNVMAPLHLEDGVRVTEVRVWYYDGTLGDALSCTLDVVDRGTGAVTTPGGATTLCGGGPCGFGDAAIVPDVVVDNAQNAYLARCYMLSVAADLFLYGYRVSYEVTEIRR